MKPLHIGSMTIERIVELERLEVDPEWLYPALSRDTVESHGSWLDERAITPARQLVLSMQSYLVRTKHHNILVEAGIGNGKERPAQWMHHQRSRYIENLAAAGLTTDDIDLVFCTHLHADHVGWNTSLHDGRWIPTFPNATYIMSKIEFDALDEEHKRAPQEPVARGSFADSVLPVFESNQALLVEQSHLFELGGGESLRISDAAGHSAGSYVLHVETPDAKAVFAGDVLHHPIGIAEPELAMAADADPAAARAVRSRLLQYLADTPTVMLPSHFPEPCAARVVSTPGGFRVQWLE